MGRRRYSEEYKREAVAIERLPGATLQQVARDLGLNANMLGRWRKALEVRGDKAFPGQGMPVTPRSCGSSASWPRSRRNGVF
jgi:transposase